MAPGGRTPRPSASFPLLALAVALLALGLLLATQAHAQEPGDLTVERFDARIDVAADGTVRVVEDLQVDFGDVGHHGIVRAIDVRAEVQEGDTQVELPGDRSAADYYRVIELDDIAVSASAPDQVEVTREGGAVELRIGDPDETVTGRHSYEIAYTVRGALNRFEDRAELTWDVTGFGWESPILETTATVTAPDIVDASCYRGPEGSTTPCEQDRIDGGQARLATGRLEPGENLTVSVGFPPEAVHVPAPLLEERWRLSRALTGDPLAVPLTAATSVLGLAAAALAIRRWAPSRDPAGESAAPPGMRGEPPRGLGPAQLRLLVHERADDTALAATVFDLGARGHLDIEHLDGGDGDAEGYRVRRRDGTGEGLADYEDALLARLFANREVVDPEDLREELGEELPRFRERVEEQAVERGWFSERPSGHRARRTAVQLAVLGAAAVVVGLALAFTSVALAAVPVAVLAVVVAVLVQRRSARTAEGRRLAIEARGFREYLTAGGAPQAAHEQFGAYLPHALALDAVPAWVGRFRTSGAPVERWAPRYFAYPHAAVLGGSDELASGVQGFSSHVGSAPSSSTSGGGGHSGGGFGGGGGGGW